MIDEKKIEEAARYYFNNRYPASQDAPFIAEGFRKGARWAINEFLNDLWHDIFNECIPHGKMVIVEYTSDGGIYYRSIKIPDDIQWIRGLSCEKRLRRWLYLDDLLPKEGGKQ